MNLWISISQKAFNIENIFNIFSYDIRGIRINLSRETYEWSTWVIDYLIELGYPANQIFLDIGNNKPRLSTQNNEEFIIAKHETFEITSNNSHNGRIMLNSKIYNQIVIGDTLVVGDGQALLKVVSKTDNSLLVESNDETILKSLSAISIEGRDIAEFGFSKEELLFVNNVLLKHRVGLIVSFIQTVEDLKEATEIFTLAAVVIPKIETYSAYKNIQEIIAFAKIIIIGRGDLALSVGICKVGLVQEFISTIANMANRPFVIATETIQSINEKPYPYRSEVVDITNSFLKGANAILLTTETAGANDPYRSIIFVTKTIEYLQNEKYD